MKDPVARTASPYTDPTVKGPRSQLFGLHPSTARTSESILSSSSLYLSLHVFPSGDIVILTDSPSLVLVSTVNKTNLHPGGIV